MKNQPLCINMDNNVNFKLKSGLWCNHIIR
jgi:hypothetical protein